MEKIKYNGYKIKIQQDMDAMNPRTEFDNVATMYCFHRNYNLGDKNPYHYDDFDSMEEFKQALIKDQGAYLIKPLYLYDHSGITINTTGFSCRWDSGQVGWIFMTRAQILEEWGKKRVTKKVLAKAEAYMDGEVKTYDQYLTGDVYGYTIKRKGEELDSCWGFYGYDYCLEAAKSEVDAMLQRQPVTSDTDEA